MITSNANRNEPPLAQSEGSAFRDGFLGRSSSFYFFSSIVLLGLGIGSQLIVKDCFNRSLSGGTLCSNASGGGLFSSKNVGVIYSVASFGCGAGAIAMLGISSIIRRR